MKTLSGIILSFALLLFFSNCNKKEQPTACFTTNPTNPMVGEPISFINCSENADGYSWTFGDGTISSEKNVIHTYTTADDFRPTLRAFNEDGNADAITHTVSVTIPSVNYLTINKIHLLKWPENSQSGSWDANGGLPDVFPKISNNSAYLFVSSDFKPDVQSGTTYTFESPSGLPANILNVNAPIYVEWYDKDPNSGSDQFMGSLGFTPIHKFASGNTITIADDNWEFQLEVEWVL